MISVMKRYTWFPKLSEIMRKETNSFSFPSSHQEKFETVETGVRQKKNLLRVFNRQNVRTFAFNNDIVLFKFCIFSLKFNFNFFTFFSVESVEMYQTVENGRHCIGTVCWQS